VTADGIWYRCLYGTSGSDLRRLLRSGASRSTIAEEISSVWQSREDRGAELRLAQPGHARGAFVSVDELRRNPHLEMHTRGG
jgi:cyclic pyranopterin phosphate synthase